MIVSGGLGPRGDQQHLHSCYPARDGGQLCLPLQLAIHCSALFYSKLCDNMHDLGVFLYRVLCYSATATQYSQTQILNSEKWKVCIAAGLSTLHIIPALTRVTTYILEQKNAAHIVCSEGGAKRSEALGARCQPHRLWAPSTAIILCTSSHCSVEVKKSGYL